MLVLTEKACSVIRSLKEHRELAGDGGIRIAAPSDGSSHLTLAAAAQPHAGDEVVEQEGARVFMEPAAATALTDKVLDAKVDDTGAIQFSLASQ